MHKVLVFQHVPYEPLGTLHPLLKKAGFRIKYVNFWRFPDRHIDVSRYDSLIVLGGPMGVYEADIRPHLIHEMNCIQAAIKESKPVLGICLGAQLIAAALGAKVARAPRSEIGWYDVHLTAAGKSDHVLGAMAATERIFQWHNDAFELPAGAECLATSEACPYQAFRYGTNVYGFQFHLEVDNPMIRGWLSRPEHQSLLDGKDGRMPADSIAGDTKVFINHTLALSRKVFLRYIDLCDERHKLRHIAKAVVGP